MYDVIIIGCGVIGAATAYALAKYECKVLVLEAENDIASGTTKANSAILHAGFDPEPNTKMARLNVEGIKLAKEICEKLDVPRIENGSLVLGFNDADSILIDELYHRGILNGVEGLKILSGDEARALEPNLSKEVLLALYAPTAAIVCPWEYTLAMAETAVINGVELKRETKVLDIEKSVDGWRLHTSNGVYDSKYVINAAGVDAQGIHEMVAEKTFTIIPTRGQYDILDKSEGKRVSCTIFQCPDEKGKGVLIAPTVHGNCLVGPSAEVVEGNDVATTPEGLKYIETTVKKSVPSVDLREKIRNFAGVRANTDQKDFIIEFAAPKFLDLAGMKSPGLSAAAAVGEEAVTMLKKSGLQIEKKITFIDERKRIRFKKLSMEEQNQLIAKTPEYGRIICRCEKITEGEIRAVMKTPIPPLSVDGVKRRLGAGLGRCQGGFCGPRVVEILAEELSVKQYDILQDGAESKILYGETKSVEES